MAESYPNVGVWQSDITKWSLTVDDFKPTVRLQQLESYLK